MAKLTLLTLASLTSEATALANINLNSDDIETAIENTLSRDGSSPNTMAADLDLNDNDILNGGNINCQDVLIEGVSLVPNATTINAQVGTVYTLVLTDRSRTITMNNSSSNTLTIPLNSSVAFAVGTLIDILMLGAGTTSVAGATSVTLNGVSAGSGAVSAQYKKTSILQVAADTWVASGDIGAVS